MVIKQKKESIHATITPYVKRKAEELVASEEFSSMSDLVNIALAEFIGKYNREQKEKAAELRESLPSSKGEQPVVTTDNNIQE